MSSEEQNGPSAPPKYSRYRSVRQAAKEASIEPEVPQESDGLALKKSMSRYRRAAKGPSAEHAGLPNPVILPPIQSSKIENEIESAAPNPAAIDSRPTNYRSKDRYETSRRDENKGGNLTIEPLKNADIQANLIPLHADGSKSTADAAMKLAEQKRKDLERLDAELAAAAASKLTPGPLSTVTPNLTSPTNGKFALFSRNRAASKTTPPKLRGSEIPSVPKVDDRPIPIVQGGGGAVPGTDAPISAVNAGERRILVRCKQSSINLPVTPETTAVDLAYSAANVLSHGISPSATIVLESYTQLGLERRIRKYEHVRDIMNSWDRDTQNALVLQASDSPGCDHDLNSLSIPRERPAAVTVYMYHSQRPGKWNKGYVTLLSTGQIFFCKRPGAKVTEKDVTNLCHLSDFDIYTPTTQQLRKTLRPPKKHCHAIKSQQKSTMFLSTENFVHFFSTDDAKLAEVWYNAVQQWRSWYLVTKRGKGGLKSAEKSTISSVPSAPQSNLGKDTDETPYTIGSFSPLLESNRFDSTSPLSDTSDENRPRQIPFHLRNSFIGPPGPSSLKSSKRHPPPVEYAHKLPEEALEADYAPAGLLGRTYSQRQRNQRERDERAKMTSGPFTGGLLNKIPSSLDGHGSGGRPKTSAGPGLSSSAATMRRPNTASPNRKDNAGESVTGSSTSGGGSGGGTVMQKPLLELNLRDDELPQQWRRGQRIVAPDGVPLVEVAGGVEEKPHMKWGKETVEPGNAEYDFVKGSLLEKRMESL